MIEGALAKGLMTIWMTDDNDEDYPVHEDIGMEGSLFDSEQRFQELGRVRREEYADRIDVRIGIRKLGCSLIWGNTIKNWSQSISL